MVGVISFSKDRHERFCRCPKCKRETRFVSIRNDGLDLREVLMLTIAASILGHSEEVNDKFYTYDVSNMEYKTSVVESINKNLRVNKKRQA